jgi:cobalt-zinc-cadmium efflux system outer membrane protein
VQWALEHNPELAAVRQQHGIAAAGVVLSQTYPFNPVLESKVRAAVGPESAGITNAVSNEHKLLLEVEVRHQGAYRRQGANAALTRTDWEIAFREQTVAIRLLRAFDGLLYRQEKLRLVEENLRLQEEAVQQVTRLVEVGRMRPADLILARTEVADLRAQFGPARTTLAMVRHDFYRTLGVIEEAVAVEDTLEAAPVPGEATVLFQAALERRADLHARQAALAEAEARLRLAVADRYGNPNLGPAYEYDPTRVNLIGVQISVPIPVFNKRQGEIQQRAAERDRAALELRQNEIEIRNELEAALARWRDASAWAETYHSQTLPELRRGMEAIELLFKQGDPSVDVVRLFDVRRRLLKACDGYLDALWETRQAEADLAAAVGDVALALTPEAAP